MRSNKRTISLNSSLGSCWVVDASDPEDQGIPEFEMTLRMGPSATFNRVFGALSEAISVRRMKGRGGER